MLDGKTFFGVGFDKIDGAWILDFGPNVDLWFTLDKFYWCPSIEGKKCGDQEDIDIRWLWFWFGYTRRY